MRLLLVRHGQTPSNVDGVLDSDAPGPPLTELGREQARALATSIDDPLEGAWVSVLQRTRRTIEPLAAARALGIGELEGLREVRAGDLEGERTREAQREYMRVVIAWATGDESQRMPGGERGTEFFERYDAALATIADSGAEDAIAVSSGAAIRCWTAVRAAGADRDFLATHPLPNTGVVALEGVPGAWRMRAWRGAPLGQPVLLPPPTADPTGAAP